MSRDVMKLALEALESCGAGHISDGGNQWHDEKLVDKAITALREALAEQPARPYRQLQDNGSKYFGESWDKAEQPAQQEPVACANGCRGFVKHSPPAQRKPLTDEDCTRIYNEANGITTKNPPITTERIFKAMRAAYGIKENT